MVMQLGDGLAQLFNHITIRVNGEPVPLSAEVGQSHKSLHFAVHAFEQRCRAQDYSEESIADMVSTARVDFTRAANRCDSPIEKQILPWLLFADYGSGAKPPAIHLWDTDDVVPPFNRVVLVPQFKFGKFRLDFAVIAKKSDTERALFAFECDGREFHNGSSHDQARDITLTAWGVITVRVTGKEIYAAPERAADKLASRIRAFFEH